MLTFRFSGGNFVLVDKSVKKPPQRTRPVVQVSVKIQDASRPAAPLEGPLDIQEQ